MATSTIVFLVILAIYVIGFPISLFLFTIMIRPRYQNEQDGVFLMAFTWPLAMFLFLPIYFAHKYIHRKNK